MRHFLLILCCSILIDCAKHNTNLLTPVEKLRVPLIEKVIPDSGYIGSVLKITFAQDSIKYFSRIFFTGGVEVLYPDSFFIEGIYVKVPFGALSGSIFATSGAILDSIPFTVLDKYPLDTVSVSWYNLPNPITRLSSAKISSRSDSVYWTATQSYDTVTIFMSYIPFDAIQSYKFKFIDNGKGKLPTFLQFAAHSPRDFHGELRSGMIKIQEWDTSGIISGMAFTAQSEPLPEVLQFWYDFSR